MPSKINGVGVQVEDTKICVVMVGLPARGKSYIAQIGKLHSNTTNHHHDDTFDISINHSSFIQNS